MSHDKSRREFLQLSSLGVAALATSRALDSTHESYAPFTPAGDIVVRLTYGDKRYLFENPVRWSSGVFSGSAASIVLDPPKSFRKFSVLVRHSRIQLCYMLNQLSASSHDQLLHEIFHPSDGTECLPYLYWVQ
jgi:hypothetical protein